MVTINTVFVGALAAGRSWVSIRTACKSVGSHNSILATEDVRSLLTIVKVRLRQRSLTASIN